MALALVCHFARNDYINAVTPLTSLKSLFVRNYLLLLYYYFTLIDKILENAAKLTERRRVLTYTKDRKNIFKMNKEVRMLCQKKSYNYNTSGVGKNNNYCEDIYIPPYNNTH